MFHVLGTVPCSSFAGSGLVLTIVLWVRYCSFFILQKRRLGFDQAKSSLKAIYTIDWLLAYGLISFGSGALPCSKNPFTDLNLTASKHHGPNHYLSHCRITSQRSLAWIITPATSLSPRVTTVLPLELRKQGFPGLASSPQASLLLPLLPREMGTWRMMAACSRNKQTLHFAISYFLFPAKPNNLLALLG